MEANWYEATLTKKHFHCPKWTFSGADYVLHAIQYRAAMKADARPELPRTTGVQSLGPWTGRLHYCLCCRYCPCCLVLSCGGLIESSRVVTLRSHCSWLLGVM